MDVVAAPPAGSWSDPAVSPRERASALLAAMTLEEKIAQLRGIWLDAQSDEGDVAPYQSESSAEVDLDAALRDGIGQITRPLGTRPVPAAEGARALAALQRRVIDVNRFGIPAVAHEECLAGYTALGATCYPVPLAWGATFDSELIEEMAERIGRSMAAVGIQQGLAPILDVVVDPRWGRTEECIGEDPYLVGRIGTSYVRGLQSAGVMATLKHFIGYSASRGARNLGPVSIGQREFRDVLAAPFEMAIAEAGVKSVMNSYSAIDGVPSAADETLLTGLLRDEWGFDGTVVADYFAISFLALLHRTAGSFEDAAVQALTAGIDVELPNPKAYEQPLVDAVRSGRIDEALVDRAALRVLTQKAELGLLDPEWTPEAFAADADAIDLDPPQDRALARRIAERSVVLLRNDGILPLARPARVALIGPTIDDAHALLGCYAFPNHVGVLHQGSELGVGIATVAEAIAAELPDSRVTTARGCGVADDDVSGIPAAVEAATSADVAIVVVGDRSGLFGRGTSGEGCDAESLRLPGRQRELLEAVLDSGVPTVVVVLSGRPYHLGTAPTRAAAIVQAFLPGEEGASAIAGVLSGRVNPAGRLPVSVPSTDGAQPMTYLAPPLGRRNDVSVLDPTAAYPFGSGLAYTSFAWSELELVGDAALDTAGSARCAMTVENSGERSGFETVFLFAHLPSSSVVQPLRRLIGWAQLELAPGERARIEFEIPADVLSFTGKTGERIVEPGRVELHLGRTSEDIASVLPLSLTGFERRLGVERRRHVSVTVRRHGPDRDSDVSSRKEEHQ
jgi:beta-xylosidase